MAADELVVGFADVNDDVAASVVEDVAGRLGGKVLNSHVSRLPPVV